MGWLIMKIFKYLTDAMKIFGDTATFTSAFYVVRGSEDPGSMRVFVFAHEEYNNTWSLVELCTPCTSSITH